MNIQPLFPIEPPVSPKKNEKGPDFAAFWTGYPRRVAKKAAARAWAKLSARDRQAALDALPRHVEVWKLRCGDDREYVPHAATWLNGARWEDELTPVGKRAGQAERPIGPGGSERQWWEHWPGIVKKGAELGLTWDETAEAAPGFKARVFRAAGPGPWTDRQRGGLTVGLPGAPLAVVVRNVA
ncbi:MAG: hypothetical protein J0H72_15150 [Burkholderiales bacterium]|nr:hypothetical protein [Burkholderiales bacterium]